MPDFPFVAISKILLITTGITDEKIADPFKIERKRGLKDHLKKVKPQIKSCMFKAKINILMSFPNPPEADQLKSYINAICQYEMAEVIIDTRNIDFLLNSDKLLNYYEKKINNYWFHIDGELIKQKKISDLKESILASIVKIQTIIKTKIPEIERQITAHKNLMVNRNEVINEATIEYQVLKKTILELEYQKTQVFFTNFFQTKNYKPRVINLNNVRQLNEAINKLSGKIQESIQKKLPLELINTQKETRNRMLKNYILTNIYEKEKDHEQDQDTNSNLFLTSLMQSKDIITDINRDPDFKCYIIQLLDNLQIEIPACIEFKTQQELDKKISDKSKSASRMAKNAACDAIRATIQAKDTVNNLKSFERCSTPPPLPPRPISAPASTTQSPGK